MRLTLPSIGGLNLGSDDDVTMMPHYAGTAIYDNFNERYSSTMLCTSVSAPSVSSSRRSSCSSRLSPPSSRSPSPSAPCSSHSSGIPPSACAPPSAVQACEEPIPCPSSCIPPSLRLRMVPSSLEEADAVVLIQSSSCGVSASTPPLLLVGPAMQRLRHPNRPLTKGARVHPYKIARPRSCRPVR
ncbi:hypothetical protein FISHEDRAFT_74193 [Fistulina hepatica ATCC 64428]|uniref:Uncharacterized protein n=1 Tax=Fistulina hepatica ATCC 64428 TaxID=1128425 RepID=A0A0D7AA44_9AGAR|nr:hypothetical protein FISHEDRAFT_74193 [Fistulina hepatica ATCC 64428]